MSFTVIALLAIICIVIVIAVLAWLFERSSREVALVRTGFGGRKVVLDGGAIVLPYFHKVDRVNMKTVRLEVTRGGDQSLITKDKMRVDVSAEFYVSVESTEDSIAKASQTLGNRTFDANQLKELIEGKLIDALRATAAQLTLDELHEGRADFVKQVKTKLAEEISRNGLELESVSLTALDQTPFDALDENNAFNAVGMRKLAEVIATSKKDRAAIDADAEVAVRRSAMEAAKLTLSIDLEEQEAQINQAKQLEGMKAAQLAEIAEKKAAAELAASRSRIEMEKSIRNADLEREETIRKTEIQQQLAIQTAEQERQIQIAKQSQDEAKAEAEASLAKAEAAKASEAIATARALAAAERAKTLDLVAAEKESAVRSLRKRSETEAMVRSKVMQAEAELEASKSLNDVKKLELGVLAEELAVKAEGQKAFNEAENALSDPMIALRQDGNRLEALPKIVEQMVKPAEKIDSIKIHHVSGGALDRSGSAGESGGNHSDKPVVNQAMDSIMDMAVQLPALKKIGEELGVSLEDGITGVTEKPKK